VPFAGNGAGDRYSWYLPWQGKNPEPPVLFCPHDEDVATFFAPDFGSCLERLWLDYGAHGGEWDPDQDVPGDLAAWLPIIRPYLDADRAKKLEKLLAKFSPKAFEKESAALVKAFTKRGRAKLEGPNLKSTFYYVEFLGKGALRLYDSSIRFFESLIADGHSRFKKQLAATKKNREKAVKELATKKPRKS
jgi:hypothetical protein